MATRTAARQTSTRQTFKLWETGADTLAGRFLRTLFWHPVYRVQDLKPGDSVPLEILSEQFTLYRGHGGTAHAVAFRCAHRGTQLSTGWVESDNIRCRYHGWMYDGFGQCVEQPGEDESFAAKVRIESYPLQEYIGLIWLYFGDGEPPPMRRHPDFEAPGVLDLEVPEYWPCNWFNRIDNACDIAHVGYTHFEAARRGGGPHNDGKPTYIPRRTFAEETPYGVKTTTQPLGQDEEVFFHYHFPNANQNANRTAFTRSGVEAGERSLGKRISWRVAVNDERTVSFSVDWLDITEEEAAAYREMRRRTDERAAHTPPPEIGDAILAGTMREEWLEEDVTRAVLFSVEDYVTQVGQGVVADRENELLGRIDQGVALMRKIWQRELAAFANGQPTTGWQPKAASRQ